MTPDEIINKWIGIGLFDDEPVVSEAESAIIAGLRADIQRLVNDEREACAEVAEAYFDTQVGETIAEYIRERSAASGEMKRKEVGITEPVLLKLALQIIADAPIKMHMQPHKAAEILRYINRLESENARMEK